MSNVTSIDYHQRRGQLLDIIDEAIAAWDQWYVDDDYDAKGAMDRIMKRMKERRAVLEQGNTVVGVSKGG